jgi:hypothetical protein
MPEQAPAVAATLYMAQTQHPRLATRSTTAKGYDHPDQFIHLEDKKPADNMYPVIEHPGQDKQARDKLTALEQKTGTASCARRCTARPAAVMGRPPCPCCSRGKAMSHKASASGMWARTRVHSLRTSARVIMWASSVC